MGGKPYDAISIDPITLGQVCLSRGIKNTLRKNVVLAVTCLNSGHISIEPIQGLTPKSIGSALWRIEENFHTKICRVYSDNFPSLRENSLGPVFEDFRQFWVALEDVVNETEGLMFHTNPSYTKCRNFVERKVLDIRRAVQSFTVLNKQLILSWEDSLNLNSAICSRWNRQPYSRRSLLSPSSFINPHSEVFDLRLELEGGLVTQTMKQLMDEVSERALESVIMNNGM